MASRGLFSAGADITEFDGPEGPAPTCNRTVTDSFDQTEIPALLLPHARVLKGRTTEDPVIEAIHSSQLPFSAGTAIEAALAQKSLASGESLALRHLFLPSASPRN